MVLTIGSMDEILQFYHLDESYWAVLSCHGNVYYAVQGGLYFFETVKNSCTVPIQMKTSLPMVLLITLYKVARTFESFNKIL